jgi:hypothetical protein
VSRAAINVGFPGPNYVIETGSRSAILPGVYLAETGTPPAPPAPPAIADWLPTSWLTSRGPVFRADGLSFGGGSALALLTAAMRPPSAPDWPNPRGYLFSLDNRSWLVSLPPALWAGVQPPPPGDWANPRGAVHPIEDRSWLVSLPRPLWASVQPPTATDFSNPRGPASSITDLLGHAATPLSVLAALQGIPRVFEWPNPRGAIYLPENRTWIVSRAGLLPPPPVPAHLTDWPNPRGPPFPADGRTWLVSMPAAYRPLPVLPPKAFDYPNPRGPIYPLSNRGFVYAVPIYTSDVPAPVAAPAVPHFGYPPAPLGAVSPAGLADTASRLWVKQIAEAANRTQQGKLNNTVTITLTAGAATTTVIDQRISAFSALLFSPLTANAAAELAAGSLYVSARTNGQAVLAHANNGQTDRSYCLVIIG